MARFYNPYHFVPVEKPGAAQQDLGMPCGMLRDGVASEKWEHVTHERYVPGRNSGRLVVRLTTVTPTVIGGKQSSPVNPNESASVSPYLVDKEPAFPGSTLRGLIGSVMEAASNGPLRILEDRADSYRRKMEESLSAIGLIVMDNGVAKLLPMCLPSLESRDGGRSFEAPPGFRKLFPKPQFKVFFGDRNMIRSATFSYRTNTSLSQAVPMPVKQLAWSGNAVIRDQSLHVKANRFAVAQDADAGDPQRPGLIRVLGCFGKDREDIPNSKTHELWIPAPDPGAHPLPISEEALERFRQLADERTDEDPKLPFEPKDTRPDPKNRGDGPRDGSRLRLRAGDMVFFSIDPTGRMVTEVSLSAIWRGRVEDSTTKKAATTFSFFRQIDPELLPFNPDRTKVSVVEQVLGFVEERKREKEEEKKKTGEPGGLALASRVRFSDALLAEGETNVLDREVRLKILGSPKQPCPVMYFKPQTGPGGYIAKRSLNPAQHLPQGRKWYLHAKAAADESPWETNHPQENRNQKNVVRPIRKGKQFFFHIDFDNLSDEELGLLLYALEPDGRFHHKVGMGKPLGLGSVKVEVVGHFEIDRIQRYSLEGLRGERYAAGWRTEAGKGLWDAGKWPGRYAEEGSAPAAKNDLLAKARATALGCGLISKRAQAALSLLGDYASAPAAGEVRYPTNADQPDKESEHFKWFVFNDGHRERGSGMSPSGQFLKPLPSERSLPPLVELERDAPKRW